MRESRGRENGGETESVHFVILNNQLEDQNQSTINNIIRKLMLLREDETYACTYKI